MGKKITNMDEYERLYDKKEDDLSGMLKGQIEKILDSQYYMAIVKKMRTATELSIPDITNTMEIVTKRYSLSDMEKEAVLQHYLGNKDSSLWGLVNAVTEASKVSPSYDRAHQLETIGTQLLYDGVASIEKSNLFMLAA